MTDAYPAYVALLETGELAARARRAIESLADCALCGRKCHADRLDPAQAKSFCRTGRTAVTSSFFPHHGEESCLRGTGGSGTIFFTHCNLRCVFCQNYDISWQGEGFAATAEELAAMMLGLQDLGCHNVNFVTPSHVVPQILDALSRAAADGLRLPIVYNTGGYDRVETLRILEGVVDIYMPDFKFWDPDVARELANAEDYPEIARQAIKEMHRQVGDLQMDRRGIARRGLLVRHLVMPNGAAGTREVMRFLAREVSPDTYVNIMAQYHPEGQALRHPSIARSVTRGEWAEAVAIARQEGLRRFDRE
jgi:putative pyruvate formate lyase activating enzyme